MDDAVSGKGREKRKIILSGQWDNANRINSATYSSSKSRIKAAGSVAPQTWPEQDTSMSSDTSCGHQTGSRSNCYSSYFKKKSYSDQSRGYSTDQKKQAWLWIFRKTHRWRRCFQRDFFLAKLQGSVWIFDRELWCQCGRQTLWGKVCRHSPCWVWCRWRIDSLCHMQEMP